MFFSSLQWLLVAGEEDGDGAEEEVVAGVGRGDKSQATGHFCFLYSIFLFTSSSANILWFWFTFILYIKNVLLKTVLSVMFGNAELFVPVIKGRAVSADVYGNFLDYLQ